MSTGFAGMEIKSPVGSLLIASRSRIAPTSERVVHDVAQPNYLRSPLSKALAFGQTVRDRLACHHDANGISVHQPAADAPRLLAPTSAPSSMDQRQP